MIVNEAISVARLVERLTVSNTIIHNWENSGFAIHKFIFMPVLTLIAVRRLIWAWTSKVTLNIAWTVIQTLNVMSYHLWLIYYENWFLRTSFGTFQFNFIRFLTLVYSLLQLVIQSRSSLLHPDKQEYCSTKQSSSHSTAACSSGHSGFIDLVAELFAGLLTLSAKILSIKKLKTSMFGWLKSNEIGEYVIKWELYARWFVPGGNQCNDCTQ